MLTQSELKEYLHYDPETGQFTWLINHKRWAGKIAGKYNKGYRQISIKNRQYLAHQLAWLYMTGSFIEQIDHVNHDKSDNRWSNLRSATGSQNQANKLISKNNTSGYKGVSWHKDHQKWQAHIRIHRKRLHLGYFSTKEQAADIYNRAAIKHFDDYAHLNVIPLDILS